MKLMRDLIHDILLLCGVKFEQPSLLVEGIAWCNSVPWIPRLIAYGQLEDWLSHKHTTNHE